MPTCLILSPLQRMHTVNSDCFEMTMPFSLLCIQLKPFVFTFDSDFCKDVLPFFFDSAINTVSSEYFRLFMLLPPTLTPSWCFMFRRIISLYTLKRFGEKKRSPVSVLYRSICTHCSHHQSSSSGARSGTDIGGHASPNISVIRQLQKI